MKMQTSEMSIAERRAYKLVEKLGRATPGLSVNVSTFDKNYIVNYLHVGRIEFCEYDSYFCAQEEVNFDRLWSFVAAIRSVLTDIPYYSPTTKRAILLAEEYGTEPTIVSDEEALVQVGSGLKVMFFRDEWKLLPEDKEAIRGQFLHALVGDIEAILEGENP